MKAARMHEYGKALVLEDVPVPDIQPDEVLVQVKACGMCRSDAQLIDGYFRQYADIPTPITLGHEITGVVHKIGSGVPKAAGLQGRRPRGRRARLGRWDVPSLPGRQHPHLPERALAGLRAVRRIRGVRARAGSLSGQGGPRLKFEELAPLTDAGLTPYRGIKKLRDAGALGPDRVLGVFGIGGLGGYAVQYAKLLGGGATVVAFARNADKLAVAKEYGADHVITSRASPRPISARNSSKATGQSDLDAIIDCAGAPEMMQLGFSLLAISGHYADVGLVGDRIDVPLLPRVNREQTFHGSYWGNNIDLERGRGAGRSGQDSPHDQALQVRSDQRVSRSDESGRDRRQGRDDSFDRLEQQWGSSHGR